MSGRVWDDINPPENVLTYKLDVLTLTFVLLY